MATSTLLASCIKPTNFISFTQDLTPGNQQPSAKEVSDMTIKSGKLLKSGLIGLVAAMSLVSLILPAKADEINQDSVQTTTQEGKNNTSVQQSTQDAQIKDSSTNIGRPSREGRSRDVINQSSDQLTDQFGSGNTSVQQNTQDATIEKNTREINNRREHRMRH